MSSTKLLCCFRLHALGLTPAAGTEGTELAEMDAWGKEIQNSKSIRRDQKTKHGKLRPFNNLEVGKLTPIPIPPLQMSYRTVPSAVLNLEYRAFCFPSVLPRTCTKALSILRSISLSKSGLVREYRTG